MACLTIIVDADVLERAHMQAAVTGVPVKEVVREALALFADGSRNGEHIDASRPSEFTLTSV